MAGERVQRTLRIPKQLIKRVEKLVRKLNRSSTDLVVMTRLTNSSVMNLALLRGVEMLESQYGTPTDVDNTRKIERLIERLQTAQQREEKLLAELEKHRRFEREVLSKGVALVAQTKSGKTSLVKVTLRNIKADKHGLYYRTSRGERDIISSAGDARELLGLPPRPTRRKR